VTEAVADVLAPDVDIRPPRPGRAVPFWVWWLDAATIVAATLLVSNLLLDGFRLTVGPFRVTATAPLRTLVLLALLAGLRHWAHRRPTLPERIVDWARRMWASPMRTTVLSTFLASRFMVLAVGLLAVIAIGYPPGAPPFRLSRNELTNLPLRWDAGWYLQLALHGYERSRGDGSRQENIAFFPAYPLLTRAGAALLGARTVGLEDELRGNRAEIQFFQHRRIVLAAMAVSLIAFAWALVYLYRLARELIDEDAGSGAVVMAGAYPYALFFSAMYSESLFLLAAVAACFHMHRRERVPAAMWGLLAGLTRPNGCLLSIPLAVMALQRAPRARTAGVTPARHPRSPIRQVIADLTVAAMPGLGMLLYTAWLYQFTGRAFAWMGAHRAWGRVYGSIDALLTDRVNFIVDQGIYNYSLSQPIELLNAVPSLGALVLAIPIARRIGLAYGVLIPLMVLPPLAAGGFLSLGRLTATLFPLFLYLGAVCRGPVRASVVLAFAVLQGFLTVLFFTWRPFY
jgi:Mannosyltransferase (PIG-V)